MLSRRLLRIKVVKALYAYFQTGGESERAAQKLLRDSIDATYALYFQMLWLVVEVRNYAAQRIELGRAKHLPSAEELNPNTRFIDNAVIALIAGDEDVAAFLKKKKLSWSDRPELIKELYNGLVESDFYTRYMSIPALGLHDDVTLVRGFYASLEDNELLEEVVEEQSVMWNDDLGFAIIMALKTLEKIRSVEAPLPVLPQFKGPKDSAFADKLLKEAIRDNGENLRLIEKYAQNWDVERISLMDNLIMSAAIAEMRAFKDEIPVKVTLDEYIEIAKFYGSPGSNLFINGVLDKILLYLQSETH